VHQGDDDAGDPREVSTRYNHDPSWQLEVEEFASCVIDDEPVSHGSSLDALRTMQLVYDIYAADGDWAARWGIAPRPAGEATAR
jgi:hypothetical protein